MKKLYIALVSALALGIVNAEETDLVVVGWRRDSNDPNKSKGYILLRSN